MKAAWIGFFGCIVGAIVGVVGTVHYQRWVEGPREGVFSAELSAMTAENLAPELRTQISLYPCSLKVAHLDGPAVKQLTVTVLSENPIENLTPTRNDEGVKEQPLTDVNGFKLEMPCLRKGSVVHFDFSCRGEPKLKRRVVMSEGKLVEDAPREETAISAWQTVMLSTGSSVVAGLIFAFLSWLVSSLRVKKCSIDEDHCEFVDKKLTVRGRARGPGAVVVFWRSDSGNSPGAKRFWCSQKPIKTRDGRWEVEIDLKSGVPYREVLAVACSESNAKHVIETVNAEVLVNEQQLLESIGAFVSAKSESVRINRS